MGRTFDTIGDYRHLVTLENPGAPVPDGAGGYTQTWTALVPATMHVAIDPATAADQAQLGSDTVVAQATHLLRLRYHPQVTTQSRVTFQGRQFAVMGVRNLEERGRRLALLCAEVIA